MPNSPSQNIRFLSLQFGLWLLKYSSLRGKNVSTKEHSNGSFELEVKMATQLVWALHAAKPTGHEGSLLARWRVLIIKSKLVGEEASMSETQQILLDVFIIRM